MAHASLTRSRSHGDDRRILLALSMLAMIGTARGTEPPRSLVRRALSQANLDRPPPSPARRSAAALVPSLSLSVMSGGAETPEQPSWWLEAWVRLAWPLDRLRDDPALLSARARHHSERERVATQVTDLWMKRQAALTAIDAAEADAELDALVGDEP
jgi:hypothetical protein